VCFENSAGIITKMMGLSLMFNKEYATVIFCASILIFSGCKKSGQTTNANKENVCPFLYQKNDSLSNALNFIEAPKEKLETYISTIQNHGELVSGDMLKFANKYLSLRTNKNADLYISMLSRKTREILDDNSKNGVLLHHINAIKDGTFIDSEEEYKYLAISSAVSRELQNTLRKANFVQMPTYRLIFYHFNRSKNILIGTTVYVIEEDGSLKIVIEAIPRDKFAGLIQPEQKTTVEGNSVK
jgi:hypothetical protein